MILDIKESAERKKAKEVLALVKEREKELIAQGWRYVKGEDGVKRLKKTNYKNGK